jgi:hypothetical protein
MRPLQVLGHIDQPAAVVAEIKNQFVHPCAAKSAKASSRAARRPDEFRSAGSRRAGHRRKTPGGATPWGRHGALHHLRPSLSAVDRAERNGKHQSLRPTAPTTEASCRSRLICDGTAVNFLNLRSRSRPASAAGLSGTL